MTEIILTQPQEINQLINYLNHSNIFENLNITSINPNQNYLKWFSPSLDYPCILNAYYLFSPYKVTLSSTPTLEIGGEIGENQYILDIMKTKLLEAIISTYQL